MLPNIFGLKKFAYIKDHVAVMIQAGDEDKLKTLANDFSDMWFQIRIY